MHHLSYSADTQSDEATSLMTRMSKLGSDISNKMIFFDLWWKRAVDEKNAKRLINDSGELIPISKTQKIVSKIFSNRARRRIINTSRCHWSNCTCKTL